METKLQQKKYYITCQETEKLWNYVGDPLHPNTTLEGDMRANIGDFIIKGLKGEFYPCKPEIFHMKYELI